MALFDNPSQDSGLFNFGVDETGKSYLLETARWTKFLSVVGFAAMGLLVLAGIFMSSIFGSLGNRYGNVSGYSSIVTVLYILIALLYFFPVYYLFKFSTLIKPALLTGNQAGFNSALSYLRNAFRFIGILMLIGLCFYALAFIIGIIGAAMR